MNAMALSFSIRKNTNHLNTPAQYSGNVKVILCGVLDQIFIGQHHKQTSVLFTMGNIILENLQVKDKVLP